MKKIIALILAGVMLLALASCGKDARYYRYDYDLSEYLEVCEYKGIPVEVYDYKVTEDDIKSQILLARSRFAGRTLVTDRAAVLYDALKVDFHSYMDGEELEDGSAKDQEVILGSNSFIDGFEEGLLGAVAGDTVTLELTYPETYPINPGVAGKDVTFVVTVKSIYEQDLPEYNDEFVKNNYTFFTTAEFEAAVREQLETKQADALLNYKISQAWEYLVENSKVKEYPQAEYDIIYKDNVDYAEYYAAKNDMTLEEYVTEKLDYDSLDDFYDATKLDTEEWMKQEMLFYHIAREENINISDEEYKKGALEYAEYYGLSTVEAIEQYYAPENIKENLLFDKVMVFLADNAKAK